ncbi:MAG TPA: murein biosynthesis integral membrane protein MurJ [Candidatus Babeliales bacterium]|nr:murein biosynthesis integral membrane protein MurJ [Candidatus Babeliales bacterium]
MLSQKTILKKTIEVGGSTLLSRFFGIVREVLMVRYLGVSGLSDAFLTAFKIPNSLRKIFAEGALSAAFIPTVVSTMQHNDKNAVAGLMSLAFLIFEGMVLLLCALIMTYAQHVIQFIAPGFSEQQVLAAIPMLHILMPFIFFISSSALLGGALHAIGHFFVPAIAPVVVNIIFIIGLCISLVFNLPVTYLCWFIVLAGFVHFLLHLIMYFRFHFFFGKITRNDLTVFARVMGKFLLCLPSVSLMEVALFIDTSFASLLAPGSISLLFYANRFVGIPLGVFAVAFSTILLPHFSRVNTFNPKRLHFYLLESAKFIFWVTMPVALFMAFFSEEIFSTIFLSKKFTLMQVQEAGNILLAFLLGLFFFSLNKILLNIFYAMHAAWIPALIALGATAINIILNMLFIERFQTVGLALATTISGIVQTIFFLIILRKKYNFRIYLSPFLWFVTTYLAQLTCYSFFFWLLYHACTHAIIFCMPPAVSLFFTAHIGLWLWVSPLALFFLILLYYSRTLFNIKLHFLK